MLPFLDSKKIVSVIAARKGKSDMEVKPEVEAVGGEIDPGLKSAAEDIMRAIESKSVIDLASAIKAAFEVCDSYEDAPQMEGEE